MTKSSRPVLTRLAASAALAAALTACASTAGRHSADRPSSDTAVVLGSSGWMNAAFETPECADPHPATRAPGENPALHVTSPWIGTVGLRHLLPGDWEVGVGVAVPNPYASNAESMPSSQRFQNVGVGVWLKLAF
jgi:hypothetical protein